MTRTKELPIAAAGAALEQGQQRHAAATAAVDSARQALDEYVARVDKQLPTSASTFADRRAALDLAVLEQEAAGHALAVAGRAHQDAVVSAAAARLAGAPAQLAELEQEARAAIADALEEAQRLASDYITRRDEIIGEIVADAEAAEAPRAAVEVWSKDGVQALSVTLAPGADVGLTAPMPPATPLEQRQHPHLAHREAGAGVALRAEDGGVALLRSAWDPAQAARTLIADVAMSVSPVPVRPR